jgi:hypothetical protein
MTNYGSGGTIAKVVDNTYQRWIPEWIKNMRFLDNRSGVLSDLHVIPKMPDIKTVIICGSGPSLNVDFEYLPKLQHDKSICIIANHSNLATLFHRGIVPDFCVISDASEQIPKRLEEIVLPNWKREMRKTRFLLPTMTNPELVKLLAQNHCLMFFFKAITREVDGMTGLYNILTNILCPSIESGILQAGCVSNVSLIICHILKLYSMTNLQDVILSGVDFSYPNGISRCETVSFKDGKLSIEEKPTWIPPDLKQIKYNGLLTDVTNIAYRNDLMFILENLRVEDTKLPFNVFTSNNNFISDFISVKPLSSL